MEKNLLFDFGEIPVETNTQAQVNSDEYQSIVLKSEVKKDKYTNYIQDTFDLKVGDVSKSCIPNKLNIEYLCQTEVTKTHIENIALSFCQIFKDWDWV